MQMNRRGELLQEEAFAELVAADEGFGGAELSEHVEDFAVLKSAGVNGERWGVQKLDRLVVDDTIAMEAFGRAIMKHRENCSAGANQLVETIHHARHQLGVKIVEQVPREHAYEILFSVLASRI